MSVLLITISAFVGVAALVGAVAVMLRSDPEEKFEERLDLLTNKGGRGEKGKKGNQPTLLMEPLDGRKGFFESILTRFSRFGLLFEQADTSLKPAAFFAISAGMAGAGWGLAMALRCPVALLPAVAAAMGLTPLMWLIFRRRKRLKLFAVQLTDALELISRALRAGHSLQSGFHLVREEMPPPIGKEFGRVFEEQNLGIPMEEAMESMTDRVPNLDLKFFVTAVTLQRQTGGDLTEILDKISGLIRERFRIWGQVQALTGEGRLSGIVLLALPPVLFLAVYRLNREYVMLLFTDPMGKKMLAIAIILQVLGALVIRKIVNIKV